MRDGSKEMTEFQNLFRDADLHIDLIVKQMNKKVGITDQVLQKIEQEMMDEYEKTETWTP